MENQLIIMEINKLKSLARRTLPIGQFDDLIRSIGECKSKGEEDALVERMIALAKAKTRHPRHDPREAKELLIYLIYIDMLGHETSWAHATAIQLCSSKNLVVKKVGYFSNQFAAFECKLTLCLFCFGSDGVSYSITADRHIQ